MIFRQHMLTLLFFMALPIAAQAEQFELPPDDNDVVGALTVVAARADETLLDLARRHGLGYEDIVRANPEVDTWLPGEGTEVLLPTRYVLPPGPRKGVILNLAEYRMYYFPEPKDGEPAIVMTYPMSIGRMDWETPLGLTRIISKVRSPTWYPPESVRAEHAADGDPLPRIVPPGPKNPLGAFAMRLGLPGYLIHSTNRPAGVGMRVTHGCIRMFPEDIRFLFDQVSVNTPVRIINEPVKVGWHGDELVMEVHRALEIVPFETDSGEITNEVLPEDLLVQPERNILTALTEQFVAATNTRAGELDWERAEDLLERADGIPMPVGRTIKNAATSAAFE
ncbi:MAG: L,D-transpeptidase family protein [Proteobacteria bacterium]|jgi:L,D-transpeptidase ErfK/SrfK|nr:L,D-transpeptidase family protein [Pseudomonadota bacterium]